MEDFTRIQEVISQKLNAMGFELYDLKYNQAGKYSSLRIFIDKPGGVTIADCEQASNELSVVLDVENFSKTPYSLEVSSPGIDRPLKTEKDFKRVLGNTVTVIFKIDMKSKTVTGSLVHCADGKIQVQSNTEVLDISIPDILSAKVEPKFQ
jgi:ribosome maturation factor RimP